MTIERFDRNGLADVVRQVVWNNPGWQFGEIEDPPTFHVAADAVAAYFVDALRAAYGPVDLPVEVRKALEPFAGDAVDGSKPGVEGKER